MKVALVVTGPPGSGKSAVAGALHDALGDEGVRAAFIEVDELERSYPPIGRERALRHLALLCDSYRAAGFELLLVTATAEDDAYLADTLAATGTASWSGSRRSPRRSSAAFANGSRPAGRVSSSCFRPPAASP